MRRFFITNRPHAALALIYAVSQKVTCTIKTTRGSSMYIRQETELVRGVYSVRYYLACRNVVPRAYIVC